MSRLLAKHQSINREVELPKLRFGSFEELWREFAFGELFTFFSTNSLSREFLQQKPGKIKNIHYGDIHTRYKSFFDINKEQVPFLNENLSLKIDEKSFCQEGDIVFADASEDYLDIGKCIEISNTANQKITAGLHTLLARPNKEIFAKGFLVQLMRSDTVRKQIMILSQGTKVLGISARHINKIIFKIPSKPEQEKIANFFTAIDEWIATLRLQQTNLKNYRRGVIQKIFSQKIRFKGKNNVFPSWKVTAIGDVIQEYKSKSKSNNEFPVFTSSRFGLIPQSDYYGQANRITDRDNKGFNIIPDGYITYRSRSDDGLFYFNQNKMGFTGVVSVYYPVFKSKNNRNHFLTVLLNYNWKTLYKYSVGTSQKVLSFTDLKKSKFAFPCDEEQEKIELFLNSVDELIVSKEKQIKLAEQWKKGLLQQMFV